MMLSLLPPLPFLKGRGLRVRGFAMLGKSNYANPHPHLSLAKGEGILATLV